MAFVKIAAWDRRFVRSIVHGVVESNTKWRNVSMAQDSAMQELKELRNAQQQKLEQQGLEEQQQPHGRLAALICEVE